LRNVPIAFTLVLTGLVIADKAQGRGRVFLLPRDTVLGVSFVAALPLPDLRRKGFLDGSGELTAGGS
jgi:hypothetical protein